MSDHYDGLRDPEFAHERDAYDAWPQERAPAPRSDTAAATVPRLDLGRLAEWLPRLGATLWLDRRDRRARPARSMLGADGILLIEHPALAMLTRCVAATAHTQVTPHGPREWLCFRDRDGEAQAKLFLLPDTDYLAWDEMATAAALAPTEEPPANWHAHTAFLRNAFARLNGHWQARLLTFDHHRLPWLRLLGAQPPLRISLLGLEFARLIARSEGAELISPLHTA